VKKKLKQGIQNADKEKRSSITAGAIAYLLLLALAIALINPFVNTGVSDDFSFIRSAKDFADTGRIIYNGWSAPILGWMLPFGALFIKLFGFSFPTVRIAAFVVAAANGLLVQYILLRAGCTRRLALLGATAVLFSPVSLPQAVLFFSDGPGLLALLVTMALCIRIVRAETPRETRLWILLAFVASLFLGTARQLLWMCALVMVPSAVWLVRRRKGVLPWAAGCFVLTAAAIAGAMHWFKHQPYSLPESLLAHYPLSAWARYLVLPTLELAVLLAPVMSLFLMRRLSAKTYALEGAVAVVALLVLRHNPYDLLRVGSQDIFGDAPQWIFLILSAYACALVLQTVRIASAAKPSITDREDQSALNLYELSVIVGPFAIALFLLAITRESFFSRYLLPVVAAVIIWLIKLWSDQRRQSAASGKLAAGAATLLVALYCAFSVIELHDLFRSTQAVLSLTQWYTAAGMPRDQLEAGFAFDGWYQIQRTGYINEVLIKVPAGAYKERDLPRAMAVCHNFFLPFTPSIHPVYGVGASLAPCFVGPELHTATYNTWLAPHHRSFFIARFAPQYALPAQ
jgi:hypothetical protein